MDTQVGVTPFGKLANAAGGAGVEERAKSVLLRQNVISNCSYMQLISVRSMEKYLLPTLWHTR